MYYTKFKTDLCDMILIGDENGINRLHLEVDDSPRSLEINPEWKDDDTLFLEAIIQLQEYAKGERFTFNLKLNPEGTDYQKKIWHALEGIPYGKSVSYKDIAIKTGNPKSSRAVGMANGKNPIPIIIPCHRVIGSNGQLTGFAFGLDIKQKMLELEAKA